MTPTAMQRAAFQKHVGPYAGAVVNGEFLNIKDNSTGTARIALLTALPLHCTISVAHFLLLSEPAEAGTVGFRVQINAVCI